MSLSGRSYIVLNRTLHAGQAKEMLADAQSETGPDRSSEYRGGLCLVSPKPRASLTTPPLYLGPITKESTSSGGVIVVQAFSLPLRQY